MCRRLLILPLLAVLVTVTTGFREPLTWPAPPIANGARVISVPVSGGDWWGVPLSQDCDVRLPSVPVRDTVKIDGCRNIRIVGGEFASSADPCSAVAGGTGSSAALHLANFAGVAHVEGLRIYGRGFSDGIWMASDRAGSVGRVQATWIGGLAACDERVSFGEEWSYEHPDCFQTWNGPLALEFDKNTCWTPYQGFYLDTNALPGPGGAKTPAKRIDIRRTNVHLDERSPNGRSCYASFTAGSPGPTHVERVHCANGTREWPVAVLPRLDLDDSWRVVQRGVPARGDEVAPGEAGIGYRRMLPAAAKPGPQPDGGSARPAWLDPPGRGLVRPARRAFAMLPALRRGLRLKVRCRDRCRIAVTTLAHGRRVGTGRGRLASAGTRLIGLRFARRARRTLRRHRRVVLTLRVTIASGSARGVVVRHVLLRRR
jgi:hypothetical protein